jgi:RES domain-containing protein
LNRAKAAAANEVAWNGGRPLVRCFNTARGPRSFNPSDASMRFRPTYDRATAVSAVVPTAYGAEDGLIALAETVLREAATSGGVLPAARLRGLSLAKLAYPDDLTLVQLNGPGLRKLGLTRARVIDTGPDGYPETAEISQALYDTHPDCDGIVWTSHQSDHGDAVILWGTRLDPARLEVLEGPYQLDGPHGLALVRAACEQLGVLLVS